MTAYFKYIPNMITIARMLAMLPLMWLMWHKEYKGALLVALVAGASDGLDGFLAKKFNWQGWLGGVLDPLADKLMMFCCYSVFVLQGIVPLWLFLLIIGRDLLIVGGATYYHFYVGKLAKASPTFISKANTALQYFLILVLLLSYSGWLDLYAWHDVLFVLAGILAVISGAHYVLLGMRMKRTAKQQDSVITGLNGVNNND